MNTAIALPNAMELPAHLQTPEAAAEIAKANADAAGGIRTGGFPKVSIEGGKFHEVDTSVEGGAPQTYMVQAAPGQPALPMMCLEAVVVAANPALVKTYYAKKWVKGQAEAPDCQSTNGVTPDVGVPQKQHDVCATCPQNKWGSKISEASGKEVKACSDTKQMVILPGSNLDYKALGLAVTPAALGDWGKYVQALSGRNIPVNSVVTNITFDHTASFPKLQFNFNRFLTAAEYAKVKLRAEGDDVKAIVSPTRAAPAPALPAPAAVPALPAPATIVAPQTVVVPTPVTTAAATPPAGTTLSFGVAAASTAAVAPVAAPAAEQPVPAKRVRRTREQIAADEAAAAPKVAEQDLSYLPPAILAAVTACGPDSPAGLALLAQFPRPAPVATPAPAPQPTPAPVAAPVATGGFGATIQAPAAVQQPAAGVSAAGLSLRDKLAAKLAKPAG